jgi:hypothetical protein
MPKYVVALGLLPLLGGCAANTQPVKSVEECRMVPNDDTGSNIKMKKECTSVPQGSSAETSSPTGTLPAPH